MISEGCEINGTVEHSVLSGGVIVEEGAVVRNSVIMEDVRIAAVRRWTTPLLTAIPWSARAPMSAILPPIRTVSRS